MANKHDRVERSRQRSGYRRKRRKEGGVWSVLRLLLSCLLCVVCFPLGLVALWTCKQNAGIKFLLTIVTAILFFMVLSYAMDIETGVPFITELQKTGRRWLNELSDRLNVLIIHTRNWANTLPPAYEQIKGLLPSFPDMLRSLANTLKPVEEWIRLGRPEGYRAADHVPAVTPGPYVTQSPTQQPTLGPAPEPTQLPTARPTERPTVKPAVTPTVTPAADPNSVVFMDTDRQYFHTAPDCENIVMVVEVKRSIALLRGARECPVCFGE